MIRSPLVIPSRKHSATSHITASCHNPTHYWRWEVGEGLTTVLMAKMYSKSYSYFRTSSTFPMLLYTDVTIP